jgi:hypothetical protein
MNIAYNFAQPYLFLVPGITFPAEYGNAQAVTVLSGPYEEGLTGAGITRAGS